MEPILRVQNLTKTFTRSGQSNLTAVNGISFDLLPGECLGIIGESGSGKTTAVNLITRLLDATEGKIFLDGEDITLKTGKSLRMIYRKMQMVFQTPTDSFDPRRTLGDGIGESLRNCGMSRHDADAQAERLLERCGLPASFAGRYPQATSALDVTVQKEILELLNELRCEQGTALSILFICHDISLVQQFCDRVLVMYHGDIVEQGAPDAVIYHPQNDYTKRLIDSVL